MTRRLMPGCMMLVAVSACAAQVPRPAPSIDPGRMEDWSTVREFMDSTVAASITPGAVLGVSYRGRRFIYGTGRLGIEDPARPDSNTIYDLASLTKVVALTTVTMQLVEEGLLDLDAPVNRYVPAFTGTGKDAVTIRHLLTHTSGLPDWRPLHLETETRREALALVDSTPLDTVPGLRYEYSDLGAIVLTQAVEAVGGHRIDTLFAMRVAEPLGLASTRYLPPAEWTDRIAPTENDPWRGRILRGEVHDENASRLGGVSGHAGLFSNVPDLLTFSEWLLGAMNPGFGKGWAVPPPEQLPTFIKRQNIPPGSSRALGWDTPSGESSGGRYIAPSSFGHTGFTGTSIWVDPVRGIAIVLLTNRVHPSRERSSVHDLRRGVADRVLLTIEPGLGKVRRR
ncbi:MAG: serine hydrolase domain-containing protein [Gemmatimonadales bacterium]